MGSSKVLERKIDAFDNGASDVFSASASEIMSLATLFALSLVVLQFQHWLGKERRLRLFGHIVRSDPMLDHIVLYVQRSKDHLHTGEDRKGVRV